MTPILKPGDWIHFSVPISGRGDADDQLKAKIDAQDKTKQFNDLGVFVLGWSASTGLTAPQINYIFRKDIDA